MISCLTASGPFILSGESRIMRVTTSSFTSQFIFQITQSNKDAPAHKEKFHAHKRATFIFNYEDLLNRRVSSYIILEFGDK